MTAPASHFHVGALIREVWRLYRSLFGLLMAAAVVVFAPISVIDVVAGDLSNLGDYARAGEIARALAVAVIAALVSLLGGIVYAAVVSSIVCRRRGIHDHPLGEVLRAVPYFRIAAADIAYSLVVTLGLILLIAPGLAFMTWFALIAPAIEIEKRGVRSAMRRSRELVRPQFWKVLVLVVPLAFLSDLVGAVLDETIAGLVHTLVGEWASGFLGELITAPFLALVVVLAFLELSGRSAGSGVDS